METKPITHKQTSLLSRIGGVRFLGICLVGVALLMTTVRVFNISIDNLVFAVVLLACPLLHIYMMRDGKHKH